MKLFPNLSLLAAGLTLCAGLSAAQYTFSHSVYSVADAPQGLASGDLNGDGYQDLVVAASNPDRLEVWLNDIDGTFTLHSTLLLPAGSDPRHVVLANLDTDGQLDAAILLYGSNQMQLATGVAGGTFLMGATVATGLMPVDIEAADADSDQDVDLLVVTQGDNTATLFFNDGLGGMTGLGFAVGNTPHGCTFGDFDGDSNLDFAVSNTGDQTVSVFENQGAGVFAAWSTIVGSHDFYGIIAGDFDNDMDDDIAVVSTDFVAVNDVTIFSSDGLGGWGPQTDYPNPLKGISELAMGDFDCDGDLDLVAASVDPTNAGFMLHDNDGSGGFASFSRSGRGEFVTDITAADFNNDGALDLASTGRDINFLTVSLNDTCGLKIVRNGSCFQTNDFVFSGATPGGVIYAMIALSPGSFTVPVGKPCAGTTVGLDAASIRLAGLQVADANGEVHVSFVSGPGSCGMWLQIMDADTCNVSNLSELTP